MSKARAGSKPKPMKKAAAKRTKVDAKKTTPKAAAKKRPQAKPVIVPDAPQMPEIRSARTEPPPAAETLRLQPTPRSLLPPL